MKLLLDTHTFLWVGMDSPRLSLEARKILRDSNSETCLSVASLWEVAIKMGRGSLSLDRPFVEFIHRVRAAWRLTVLPIEVAELEVVRTLPAIHRDPFDRLLVAQSLVYGLSLVSCDKSLDDYGIQRVW